MSPGLRDVITALLAPIRSTVRHLHRVAHIVAGSLRQAWDRHSDRVNTDPTYRRTLVTAVTALATTMVPNPALAAALGVWITDTPTRSPLRPVDPEYDPDDEDDPPPWRPRPTLWNTFGQ